MLRKSCPVCLSLDLKLYATQGISYCNECTHVFQTYMQVTAQYDEQYVEKFINLNKHNTTGAMPYLRAGYSSGFLQGNQVVVDVGYADGAYLRAMEHLGHRVYGIDVHGLDFGIEEVTFQDYMQIDLMTFFDSLEHLIDPYEPLKMDPETVIVTLPHRPRNIDLIDKHWRHYRPGEHLHYFSLNSLCRLFSSGGWELVHHCYLEDAIRGQLTLKGEPHPNILTACFKKASVDLGVLATRVQTEQSSLQPEFKS